MTLAADLEVLNLAPEVESGPRQAAAASNMSLQSDTNTTQTTCNPAFVAASFGVNAAEEESPLCPAAWERESGYS